MAHATTIGRMASPRRAGSLMSVRLVGAKSIPGGAWTGRGPRAHEDGA